MKKQNEGFWIRIGAIAVFCLLTLGIILVLPSCTGSETTTDSGVTTVTMEVLNRPSIPIVNIHEPSGAPKYYGDRWSNNTPSSVFIDDYMLGVCVTAQSEEVLPDTYVLYDEWAQTEYRLLRLKTVKLLKGLGMTEEFYYMLPAQYMTDFSIFDYLMFENMAQIGHEYSVVFNKTQDKAEQLDLVLFDSYYIWECMAFDASGNFDARLWNANDAWIMATKSATAYDTLAQAELAIEQKFSEWDVEFYVNVLGDVSGEAATAFEAIKSMENGLFIPSSAVQDCYSGWINLYTVRYINGFSTNEGFTLSRWNGDNYSYTKARFSEDDMSRLPDLTSAYEAVIDALESGLITPPHFTHQEKANSSSSSVYGWYAKTENGVVGIIRVSWRYYSRSSSNSNTYYDDMYYIIEYGSDECKALSRDALLVLLGEYEATNIYTGGYNEYGKYMDGTVPREK